MHFSTTIVACSFLILLLVFSSLYSTFHFQNIITSASAAYVNASASVALFDNQTKTKTTSSPSSFDKQTATSYFIFPSQKAFFGRTANATKQVDAAMLSGKWTIQQSRAIATEFSSLAKKVNKPSPQMKSITDYYVATSGGKDKILLRIYDPGVMQKPSPVLIFVHGGGWTVGSVDIYDDSIRRLANSSGLMVAAMDYRLAPEHPFPTGLNDVISTAKWIANNGTRLGIDTNKMALGGDSAGANLALSAALALHNSNNNTTKQHHNLFRVLYLLYGPYSPDLLNSTSMKMFGDLEFGLTYGQMKFVMNQTFKNGSDYKNPLAFPLLAKNLSGLPPIYIAAMALDPLKDDSIKLADHLQQQGQEYYLTIWPGVSHGALSLIPITPEIQKYLDAMTTYLRVVLTQS
ncbi:MAG TPA: alpha/beta hydrolase [Candidatus Nitrosopolaris sp.]|nr:alpha/beta hydrolase [Candidatus Nitrosopolaris sp.]